MNEKEIILPDDPRAAEYRTGLEGWVSRHGRYFGTDGAAERVARYDGSTHRHCDKCGKLMEKQGYCRPCYRKRQIEKYQAMEEQEWDGEAMLYSERFDKYYMDLDGVFYDMQDSGLEKLSEAELIICTPNYATIPDSSWFDDVLPAEDDETPDALVDLIKEFNEKASKIVLSWGPGKYRLKTDTEYCHKFEVELQEALKQESG